MLQLALIALSLVSEVTGNVYFVKVQYVQKDVYKELEHNTRILTKGCSFKTQLNAAMLVQTDKGEVLMFDQGPECSVERVTF